MKNKLSHRWRIALAAAGVAAVLFAVVLLTAHALMVRMERNAAAELLGAPMSEIENSLESGEPLDEELGALDRVTVVVFDTQGKETFRSGYAHVIPWAGKGELTYQGRDLLFRTEKYGDVTVVGASDWTESHKRLNDLRGLFLLLLIPLSAFVGLAAFVAAGLMYRPLRELTNSAQEMAASGRIASIADPQDPDFSPLAQELNVLLTRISTEIERQDRLVTDIAHDLGTPLTVIRGRLETAILKGQTDEYRPAMEIAIRETVRLSRMADAILKSQEVHAEAAPLELSQYVADAIDRWSTIFTQRNASLTGSFVKCSARITQDEWVSLLDNFLDNAFKYGGDQCRVELSCGEQVRLEVSDNGRGVPAAHRDRIFERFVRLDDSRGSGGHGLGLYLCATTVRARGGSIRVESGDSCMKVIVELPRA